MDNKIILQMKNISKSFEGAKALDNVHFELYANEIHALVGENGAGKSTLMKILSGLYSLDNGEIILKGKKVVFKTPSVAIMNGITMIHQEFSLVTTLDVAENIWLGRESRFSKYGILSKSKRYKSTCELFERLEIKISPKEIVNTLSVANMQLVEIARAISYNAEIIIMDEPTSALTNTEIKKLFKTVKELSNKGIAIIFISHKLEEIFEICNRITVFRDGKNVGTKYSSQVKKEELISMIVGRELADLYPKKEVEYGDVAIEVKNLTKQGVFRNINFKVKKGEILGFWGLMGAGRTEIMNTIFGLSRYDSGEIFIEGKPTKVKSAGQALKAGIGFVTEDRLRTGVIYALSVKLNTSIAYLRRMCNKLYFFNLKREMSNFKDISKSIGVKYSSPNQLMGSLSGGNQQKVIIGRWLLTKPKILIMDEPTRGIDVGSKAEIHKLIGNLVEKGMAIILVSSEMPELLGVSDRILVVRNGEIISEYNTAEASQEKLIYSALGEDIEE